MNKIMGCFFVVLSLVACGGGSDGVDDNTEDTLLVEKNVALSTNGGIATATYDNDSASYVNDGDTSTSYFWAGNITGDTVTVDLGRIVEAKSITIYTNDTSYSSSSPNKLIEVSEDNENWSTTAEFAGGDIPCFSIHLGSGKIECGFSQAPGIRYIRVKITATQNIGLINIHEIEVIAEVAD